MYRFNSTKKFYKNPFNPSLEIYKYCLEQSLTQAHSFNCQIPKEKLDTYNLELKNLLNLASDPPSLDIAKELFKKAKKENDQNSGFKILTFSKYITEFDEISQTYYDFPNDVIIDVEDQLSEIIGYKHSLLSFANQIIGLNHLLFKIYDNFESFL